MDESDTIPLLASLAVAIFCWARWYYGFTKRAAFAVSRAPQLPALAAPPACALMLFAILRLYSSHDVRNSAFYLFFYMLMGAAWTGLGLHFTRWFGIDAWLDAAERGNRSAAFALAGAATGLTGCYAGANIGDGPGWWVVVVCAALATAAWALAWAVLEALAGFGEEIAVERNERAGILLGGYLAASGLLLGGCVAGDWVSLEGAVHDFGAAAWPALLLVAAAIVLERVARAAGRRAVWLFGAGPALALLAVALAYVATLGVFE